jgi:hypothetical protein
LYYNTGDSTGLLEYDSPVVTIMEPLWQTYCDKISRADFWVMFAKLVVDLSSGYNITYVVCICLYSREC